MFGAAETIGLAVVVYVVLRVQWWAYTTFLKRIDLSPYQDGQSWAVVTGATDGIGLAFAKVRRAGHGDVRAQVLAEHGFNILLVGRSVEKLGAARASVQSACARVQVDYAVSDANDTGAASLEAVVGKTAGRDFSILVNNVGIGQGGQKHLHELDPHDIEGVIRVNCTYPTLLTRLLVPVLQRHGGRKLVVNVSSVAALLMNPLSSVYSGTKAYNRLVSMALSAEYSRDRFDVLSVDPGFVESNLTKMRPSLICCTARECAECALRKIGDIDVIPHWKHTLMYALIVITRLVPTRLLPTVAYHTTASLRRSIKRTE